MNKQHDVLYYDASCNEWTFMKKEISSAFVEAWNKSSYAIQACTVFWITLAACFFTFIGSTLNRVKSASWITPGVAGER